MTDFEIIGMLKTFVAQSLVGVGALKGAACQIQSIVDNGDGTQTVTFKWEDNDGDSHTSTMNTPSAIFDLEDVANGQIIEYDSTSGKWKNANKPTIDAALSDTSENAVQNKVIYDALDDKVNKEAGKGLSANDFTNALKQKVEASASSISVNGVAQTITSGAVDLDVATNLITEAQWTQIQSILA
jgi:hypothetical protein